MTMKANVGFSDKEIMKAQKKYAKMSDEELCEMIRKKTQELGRTPRVRRVEARKVKRLKKTERHRKTGA